MGKLMLTAGLCLVIATLASASTHPAFKLVCFYDLDAKNRESPAMLTADKLDPNLCSHLILGSAATISDNYLVYTDASDPAHYRKFNELKYRNSKLQTLLSVGASSELFRTMASTQENRKKFIWSAVAFLRYYRFDGLTLDWKFPEAEDKDSFTLLVKELRAIFALEAARSTRTILILSAGVSADKAVIDAGYDATALSTCMDFLNVLTFDFRDYSGGVAEHATALFQGDAHTGTDIYLNAASIMEYWNSLGVDEEKLILTVVTYATTYTLSSGDNNGVGAAVSGPGTQGLYTNTAGYLAYYETCGFVSTATVVTIAEQKVSYAYSGNQWVSYENFQSLTEKVKYVKAKHFGGICVASLDLDDFSGSCSSKGNKFPLTRHLHYLLLSGFPNLCVGKPDGLHIFHHDHHYYYNCYRGAGHLERCPNNYVYTPYSYSCQPQTTTPSNNPCYGKINGLLAHPYDKHCFINCGYGKVHIQCCPANLVFNVAVGYCDYHANIHNGINCAHLGHGVMTNPHNQHTYYKCKNGHPFLHTCPGHLIFTGTSCGYPTSYEDPCDGKVDGVYPHYYDEHSYVICRDGKTYKIQCYGNKVYKESCHCCAHPPQPPISCFGHIHGLFPHPDKTKFYHCSNGYAYIKNCPANLIFNAQFKVCDYPHNLGFHCAHGKIGYSAHSLNNHFFFKCNSGVNYFLECPENYWFDTTVNQCVYRLVNGHSDNPCYGKNGAYLTIPGFPQYFYHCANSIAYLKKCPGTLQFDTSYCNCCNWPPSPEICKNNIYGYAPNPINPNTYYQCDHGVAHLRHCPPGLTFQSPYNCCNWPYGTFGTFCNNHADGLFPSKYSKHYYYNCYKKKTYHYQCPGDLVYSHYSRSCDFDTPNPCAGKKRGLVPHPHYEQCYYNCYYNRAQVQCCGSNLVFRSSCQCCERRHYHPNHHVHPCRVGVTGLYPYASDNTYYYSCANGHPYVLPCPANTIFGTTSCVYPSSHHYKCLGSGVFPNLYDVRSFFLCDHGIAHKKYCPPNTVFEPINLCCTHKTTVTNPHTCHSVPNGLLPHSHPGKFYHCSNGVAYVKSCPGNTIFKPSLNICVHRQPTHFPCSHGDGYYPGTHSSTFYNCVEHVAHVEYCPDGSQYDEETHSCVPDQPI